MGKPSQASEAQLNAWVSSLCSSGDILTTSTTNSGDVAAAVTKRQQRKQQAKQRHRGEAKFKRDFCFERPTGTNKRATTQDAINPTTAATTTLHRRHDDEELDSEAEAVNNATDKDKNDRESNFQKLKTLSLSIKTVSKFDPRQQKYKEPYAPGKLPAASVSKRKLNLQPRPRDYGGIGLAKPSVWVALDESGWRRKLNKNFLEHIPGFFGKHRTKAMKKQLDGDMLWRQRLAIKLSKEEKGTKKAAGDA